MKKTLLSIIALGTMTSTAFADPVPLTDSQMDSVTAGAFERLNLTIYAPLTVNVFTRGDAAPANVNVSNVLSFTFVNNETVANAFATFSPARSTFGILTPSAQASALSQALGLNSIRVFQQ